MQKNLLIVFVKNILLGKVKTRLAKTIGDQNAFEVYKHLVGITERETIKLTNCTVQIYFSDVILEDKWPGKEKFVQHGEDLGERMKNAINHGFHLGYERIVGVGSDLPDLTSGIIHEGLEALKTSNTVFGPSEDGGYYLIGMNQMIPCVFENKAWSTPTLLTETQKDLEKNGFTIQLLAELNDVDTLEDLRSSSLKKQFSHLFET